MGFVLGLVGLELFGICSRDGVGVGNGAVNEVMNRVGICIRVELGVVMKVYYRPCWAC